MGDYMQEMEEKDGLRWTWHTYPSKAGKEKSMQGGFFTPEMIVPLAAVITPLKASTTHPVPELRYAPSKCKGCGGVANSFCIVNHTAAASSWTCVFCRTRNPVQAAEQMPAEFTEGVNTVEYCLPRAQAPAPTFIFILDVATNAEELEGEKQAVLDTLPRLPPGSLVGLITLGKFVTVWDLAFEGANCTVFTGAPAAKKYPTDTVREYLGIKKAGRGGEDGMMGRVLMDAGEAVAPITNILEDLTPDPWPVKPRMRQMRSTGAALEVAVGIAELLTGSDKSHHGRILLFLSGPCARGPGKMCSPSLDETLRCHPDIKEGQAPHMAEATEFGNDIAKRLRAINFCFDLFMISLDQVGLCELGEAVVYTGGYVVSSDSFHNDVFKQSMAKMFMPATNRGTSNMFFDVILEVQTSSETKIAGCIGPCRGKGKTSSSVSTNVEVGDSGTCAWSTAVCDDTTSFAVVFDAEEDGHGGGSSAGGFRFAQFITSFVDTQGFRRLRVTTARQGIAQSSDKTVINEYHCFDQYTAAAVMGRIVAKYMEGSGNTHIPALRWLDRSLIRFVKKFATFNPNQPDSLHLPPQYTLFPQFMYHLRRSEFLLVFNSSVDETVFFRSCLYRESVMQCVVMLEPKLYAYAYGSTDGEVVVLDSRSVKFDNILLLDGYFNVVIHHGATIAQWRDAKYHEQPGYEPFGEQLAAPVNDMNALNMRRFPLPKITICDQNDSQSRYLIHKLNPSDTESKDASQDDVQIIHTDDANLQTFMQKLKTLACSAEK